MKAARVSTKFLRERLDPKFYDAKYVEAALRVTACGFKSARLTDLVDDDAPITYGIVQPGSFVSATQGVRLIRAVDFRSGSIEADATQWVSHEIERPYARARVKRGDYLITIAGTVGEVAIAPNNIEPANLNQSVARMRFRSGSIDPAWLLAFHQSYYGRLGLLREQRGSIQQHLNIEDIGPISVPSPAQLAQRYIGDKGRQAERLRERARKLESSVAALHSQYIVPAVGIDFGKRTRRLPSRSLTERLDAHYYPAAVEQYFKTIVDQTLPLKRVATLVTNGQSQPEATNGVPQATVANLGRSFVEGNLRMVSRPTDGARALAVHDLLLCNAAHNKSYIGRDVTYCQLDGPFPSTEVMVIRCDREKVPASFVRQYLKSRIGYLQIQATIRGITAHSYPGDVNLIEIPIPNIPEDGRTEWFATDEMMLMAGQCADMAGLLTTAAKLLVEHLIEGRLTESDLIAAQQALEGGDRSADRAILQGLRRGEAADAMPLFPDLDALYALLDETTEAGSD